MPYCHLFSLAFEAAPIGLTSKKRRQQLFLAHSAFPLGFRTFEIEYDTKF